MKSQKDYMKLIQTIFFGIITLNLEWALWTALPLNSSIFAVACVGVFALNFILIFKKIHSASLGKSLPTYIAFIIWSIVMIIVSDVFYHIYRDISFLVFTMDAHAIFYIRMFVSVIPCMLFVDLSDFNETKLFKVIFGLIILSNTVFTFRAVRVFPDALRARGTMEYMGEEEYLLGTPDYAMVYGMAILFPVLLQKCKNAPAKSKDKWFYTICTVMVAYMIVVSQFATALLITVLGTIVFFLLNLKSYKRFYAVFIVIFVAFFVRLSGLDIILVESLAENVSGTWAEKLRDIAETFSGGTAIGSVSGRTDLYTKSLQAFKESPVFGKMLKTTTDIGGHATAIDILGLAGIVGFIPFILTIYFNYKRLKSTADYSKNKPAIIACTIEFVMLVFSKNIITSLSIFFAFFVMAPFLLKLKDDEEVYE